MLRKAIQDGTRIGTIVRDTLQSGALVGDDLMISLVGERLESRILPGVRARRIPANDTAGIRARCVGGRSRPVHVIALVVHADEVIRRLAGRGREDDEAFVIKERLAVYSRETEPVLEYYRRRNVVTILDGNRPMDAVTEAIERVVRTKAHLRAEG